MTTHTDDRPRRMAHEVTDRSMAAWRSRDPHAVAMTMSEDVRYEAPSVVGGSARGRAGAEADVAATFRALPDFTLHEIDRLVSEDGGLVMVHWRVTGTFLGPLEPPGFSPTGTAVAIEGTTRTDIADGLIRRFRLFYDLNELSRQMGAIPPPGSAGERMVVRLQRLTAARMRRRRR